MQGQGTLPLPLPSLLLCISRGCVLAASTARMLLLRRRLHLPLLLLLVALLLLPLRCWHQSNNQSHVPRPFSSFQPPAPPPPQTIIEAARMKEEGRVKKVVVTGCLAQRYSEELAAQLPEADLVVG